MPNWPRSGAATPTSTPEPPVAPPIIAAKVDDQGTSDPADDLIVGGATFEFRADDGDHVYEPTGDDAPVLATVEATHGFAVFTPPAPGQYWVTEVSAPPGLDTAPPQLVSYSVPSTPQNCSVVRSVSHCVLDEDASGGFVVVVISDSPSGGVESGTGGGTLPATDTGSDGTGPSAWIALVAVVALSCAGFLAVSHRRRN